MEAALRKAFASTFEALLDPWLDKAEVGLPCFDKLYADLSPYVDACLASFVDDTTRLGATLTKLYRLATSLFIKASDIWVLELIDISIRTRQRYPSHALMPGVS